MLHPLDDSLAQLRADLRRLTAELRAAQPGTDDYGRIARQLDNVTASYKQLENRARGGGQPRLF